MLNNFDLYDIHAILVNIRNDPNDKYNKIIVSNIIKVLETSFFDESLNQIRYALSLLDLKDKQEYSFVYTMNKYTYITGFIRKKSVYSILRCIFESLLNAIELHESERISDLADAVHNLPILLVEYKYKIPKFFWKCDMKFYHKKWEKYYLLDYKDM